MMKVLVNAKLTFSTKLLKILTKVYNICEMLLSCVKQKHGEFIYKTTLSRVVINSIALSNK